MTCCFKTRPPAQPATGVFSPNGPFNLPIPSNPILDPNSAAMSSNQAGRVHVMNVYEFGTAVYDAAPGTPKFVVNVLNSPDWGPNAFTTYPAPLTSLMQPTPGADGAMSVIDWSTRLEYEFWQYSWNNGAPKCSWGTVFSLDSDGVISVNNTMGAVGAGFSRLAGVVRMSELTAGLIRHPLVFSSGMTGAGWRYPARKSDGHATGNVFDEGHRIQLNPSVNVDSLSGPAVVKTIARALQTYGAYCMDVGGTGLNFIFEMPHAGEPDPYPGLGVEWDYFGLTQIPWSQIRVLRSWNGT